MGTFGPVDGIGKAFGADVRAYMRKVVFLEDNVGVGEEQPGCLCIGRANLPSLSNVRPIADNCCVFGAKLMDEQRVFILKLSFSLFFINFN